VCVGVCLCVGCVVGGVCVCMCGVCVWCVGGWVVCVVCVSGVVSIFTLSKFVASK